MQRQLTSLGIQPEAPQVTRPTSATLDYRMLDPAGAIAFDTARIQRDGAELGNQEMQQRIDMNVFKLDEAEVRYANLDKTIRNEFDLAAARIQNVNLTNEQLDLTLNLSKQYDPEKYRLRNEKLKIDAIRAKAGSSIEASDAYLVTEFLALKEEKQELIEAGVSEQDLENLQSKLDMNEETRTLLGTLSGKGTSLFSKESASSVFKNLLAINAESLGVGYTKSGVGDTLQVALKGNGYDVHRVYQKTLAAYRKQYGQFDAARLYANSVQQAPVASLNTYIVENVHKAIKITDDKLLTAKVKSGQKRKFDPTKLKRGAIYDLRGNERLFNTLKQNFRASDNFAHAIWDGKKFLGVTKAEKDTEE